MKKIRHATAFSLILQLSILCGCSNNSSNGIDVNKLVNAIGSPGIDELIAMETAVQSVPDALPIIVACRDTIRAAASSGETRPAHRPLEVLGRLLNHLTFLLQKVDAQATNKQDLLATVVALNLKFDAVHVRFDRDGKLVYEPVSDEIDATIAELERLCASG